ncbi:hypothetical protein MMC28_004234 [Mycoblastus sanguinarius]|nr:hypothetical protein [Mycoblastus sanguinarius]
MFVVPSAVSVFYTTLLLVTLVSADCECGYTANSTLYTDLIETDFLHLTNITTDTDWQPQNYTVTSALARGPYGKNASLNNVVANPLKSQYDWAGNGINGGDAGLQLFVRGGNPVPGGLIPMAEVATTRGDLLYGSFRAGMKVTATNGTCGAFFWYWNDTQEIDMEFLSSQFNGSSHPVNLVLQSPASEEAGFNAANTGTFQVHSLPFNPSAGFHEYRFDWSPNSVQFYADGVLLDIMTKAIPNSPGHVTLSHWSTGNPDWSAGPPITDAILTVEYLKGYFNSSNVARQDDWSQRCKDSLAPNATCTIPEITEAPNGNVSAKTYFFSLQANMTGNQTVSGSKMKSQGIALESSRTVRVAMIMVLLLSQLWMMQGHI